MAAGYSKIPFARSRHQLKAFPYFSDEYAKYALLA